QPLGTCQKSWTLQETDEEDRSQVHTSPCRQSRRQSVIGNEHLFVDLSAFSLRTVSKGQGMNLEVSEDLANLRFVIERKQESSFEPLEQACQFDIVVFRKIEFVVRQSKIRRIEVKEIVWPVITLEDFLIRQALKLHSEEPLVSQVEQHW